jgi:hypothetical protein
MVPIQGTLSDKIQQRWKRCHNPAGQQTFIPLKQSPCRSEAKTIYKHLFSDY